MRYAKIVNRPKGTVETFEQDASVVADNSGLAVDTMVASITSGTGATINSQSYATESLLFQMNFSQVGSTVVKITTTFSGSDETQVQTWLLRTTDDGTGTITDYM